ncbi:MAG: aminodeoxychorismate synthase component I [Balneolaceae bacterium]
MKGPDRYSSLIDFFSTGGPVLLLESSSSTHSESEYSYLAADPVAAIQAWGNRIEIRAKGDVTTHKGDPWKALEEFRRTQDGWLFGYLGYDLKNKIEILSSSNPDPAGLPEMYFFNPRFLLKVHEKSGREEVLRGTMPSPMPVAVHGDEYKVGDLQPATSRETYLEKIKFAQHQIKEGDYYEVNLSHMMHTSFSGNPYGMYRSMREIGPVPFGAFLKGEGFSVCCMSPERFLKRKHGTVISQPIKGTIRRDKNPGQDEKLKQELAGSSKNRAENLMIVDLVRNDLSRVALPGSVRVPRLFEIQSFGTVHQMVSTVSAEVGHKDPVKVLKACFPMGSMTGAPKISAMRAIEKLENYKRGVYSGAIGYIDPDGDFDFNVVIRTAIITKNRLFYPVGGAITSDSIPAEEWEETLVKARALTETVPQ